MRERVHASTHELPVQVRGAVCEYERVTLRVCTSAWHCACVQVCGNVCKQCVNHPCVDAVSRVPHTIMRISTCS